MTRALGLAGIPVIVAGTDAESPAFASRFCSAGVLLPALEARGAAALVRLGERLSRALGRPVPLFYGNDDFLDLVVQNRGRLAQHFRFVANDAQVSAALLDKERFAEFARLRGLPVPRTLHWDELADARGPVLVKPKVKVGWENTRHIYRRLFGRAGKARIFDDPRQALAHPVVRALQSRLLIQEYVPGDDRDLWSFHGYADENAGLLAWFTGRKIRTYPALTGDSSFLELAHHGELAALGQRIAACTPLKGPFKMDFKYDRHRATWYLLEVNARFNLWHYLGARNGVNLPLVAYAYLLDGTRLAAPARFRTKYRWLHFRSDYRAYRELAARGKLGFWRWVTSLAGCRKLYPVFAWVDPMPFVVGWLHRARRLPRFIARLAR